MKRPDQSEIIKTYQVIKNIIELSKVGLVEKTVCNSKTGEYDIVIELVNESHFGSPTPIKITVRTISDLKENDIFYHIQRKKVYSLWFEYKVQNTNGSINTTLSEEFAEYIKRGNIVEEISEQCTTVRHQLNSYINIETDDSLFFLNKLIKILEVYISPFLVSKLSSDKQNPKDVKITATIAPIDRFKKIREGIGNWIKQIAHPETCTEDCFEYIAINDKVYRVFPHSLQNEGLNATFSVVQVSEKTPDDGMAYGPTNPITIKRLTKKLSD